MNAPWIRPALHPERDGRSPSQIIRDMEALVATPEYTAEREAFYATVRENDRRMVAAKDTREAFEIIALELIGSAA